MFRVVHHMWAWIFVASVYTLLAVALLVLDVAVIVRCWHYLFGVRGAERARLQENAPAALFRVMPVR